MKTSDIILARATELHPVKKIIKIEDLNPIDRAILEEIDNRDKELSKVMKAIAKDIVGLQMK